MQKKKKKKKAVRQSAKMTEICDSLTVNWNECYDHLEIPEYDRKVCISTLVS